MQISSPRRTRPSRTDSSSARRNNASSEVPSTRTILGRSVQALEAAYMATMSIAPSAAVRAGRRRAEEGSVVPKGDVGAEWHARAHAAHSKLLGAKRHSDVPELGHARHRSEALIGTDVRLNRAERLALAVP